MKLLATCAIIMVTTTLAPAQTITVFQTGFEPAEGYVTGNLNGQNGWFAYLGENPNFGRVSSANPLSGSQSILLDCLDVSLTTFGNYAAVGRMVSIAPDIGGVPLRYIEVTGRSAILDPTMVATHISNVWLSQYHNGDSAVGAVAPGSHFGQYAFGWPVGGGGPNPHVIVTPGATFTFRHVLDYQTGLASAWKDGAVVFVNFDQGGLELNLPTNQFYFEGVSGDNLPFDTKVWYDDIHMKAIYGCGADTNGDVAVGVNDLLAVIIAWGACPSPPAACPANVVNTGSSASNVDVDDLLAVITGWGSCD
jgi:hypothetical protein